MEQHRSILYFPVFLLAVLAEELPMPLEELEKYPLISRTERASQVCEGILEIVKLRDVHGEEIGTVKAVYQPTLHAVLEESKTKGHTEVWHRSGSVLLWKINNKTNCQAIPELHDPR